MPRSASEENSAYYENLTRGQDEYWRKMAAPRSRTERITAIVASLRASSVADLGCGNGALLAELGDALTLSDRCGIDLSSARIAANRALHEWGEWLARDLATDEPLDESLAGRFDVVTMCEIVEHLDAPEKVLEKALGMLKPNGSLVLTTQSGPMRETERRVGHRRHYDERSMRLLLGEAGFLSVRVWNEGWPFHDLSKWYANLDPDKSLSRFAGGKYGAKENAIAFALRALFRLNSKRFGAQLYAIARRG